MGDVLTKIDEDTMVNPCGDTAVRVSGDRWSVDWVRRMPGWEHSAVSRDKAITALLYAEKIRRHWPGDHVVGMSDRPFWAIMHTWGMQLGVNRTRAKEAILNG